MTTTVTATRSGDWWAVEAPSIPGLFTQVKRLDQIPELIEDAAAMLGVDLPASDVEVQPILPEEDQAMLDHARQARAAAQAAETEASAASRALIAKLRTEGLTVRDVAMVIGISPQRVSALDPTRKAA